jgi:2'-5' RNA ligase
MAALRPVHAAPFAIQLDPPDFFERSGVFFADVRMSPELSRLQQRVTAATQTCGFEAEDRPYHPHITLARSKGGRQALSKLRERLHGGVTFSRFVARAFRLYESFPDPGGSRYEVRAQFPLSASAKL